MTDWKVEGLVKLHFAELLVGRESSPQSIPRSSPQQRVSRVSTLELATTDSSPLLASLRTSSCGLPLLL